MSATSSTQARVELIGASGPMASFNADTFVSLIWSGTGSNAVVRSSAGSTVRERTP